jgi:hypothetical protein
MVKEVETGADAGLEAGPLSQWPYLAMRQAGLALELLETGHVHNAPPKTRLLNLSLYPGNSI